MVTLSPNSIECSKSNFVQIMMRRWLEMSCLAVLVFCLALMLSCQLSLAQASGGSPSSAPISDSLHYSADRSANFIFLVDVSGSMLFPANQVRAADGRTVTLFEALREALKQIAQDERLLINNNKINFIKFFIIFN